MHQQNTTGNVQYARIFLALPLISILPYIPTLVTPRTSLLSVLSISSLLSTAYLVYVLPPEITSIPFLDAWNTRSTRSPSHLVRQVQDHGPIQKYLPYLNLGLCTVLGFLGMVFRAREEVWWGFGWLPAGVYGTVLLAKVTMGSVDPEAELVGLKYELKGA